MGKRGYRAGSSKTALARTRTRHARGRTGRQTPKSLSRWRRMRNTHAAPGHHLQGHPGSYAGCTSKANAHTATTASTLMISPATGRRHQSALPASDPRYSTSRGTREAHRAGSPPHSPRSSKHPVVAPCVLRLSGLNPTPSIGSRSYRPRNGRQLANPVCVTTVL